MLVTHGTYTYGCFYEITRVASNIKYLKTSIQYFRKYSLLKGKRTYYVAY